MEQTGVRASLPGAGQTLHQLEQGSVRAAPSFFHRHHLLMQLLIFKLRSFEVFLPGLLLSRQIFLVNAISYRQKSFSSPSLG